MGVVHLALGPGQPSELNKRWLLQLLQGWVGSWRRVGLGQESNSPRALNEGLGGGEGVLVT